MLSPFFVIFVVFNWTLKCTHLIFFGLEIIVFLLHNYLNFMLDFYMYTYNL